MTRGPRNQEEKIKVKTKQPFKHDRNYFPLKSNIKKWKMWGEKKTICLSNRKRLLNEMMDTY